MKKLILLSFLLEFSVLSAFFFGVFSEPKKNNLFKFIIFLNFFFLGTIFIKTGSIAVLICSLGAVFMAWITGVLLTTKLNVIFIVFIVFLSSFVDLAVIDIGLKNILITVSIFPKLFFIFFITNTLSVFLAKHNFIRQN